MNGDTTPHRDSGAELTFQRRRHLSRTLATQFLYSADLKNTWTCTEEEAELFRLLLILSATEEDEPPEYEQSETTVNRGEEVNAAWGYASQLIQETMARREALDKLISEAAMNWTLERMPMTDRAILRMGAYEVTASPKGVTPAIAINEAVELAKEFGQADSPKFINGVLDKIRRNLAKSARQETVPPTENDSPATENTP
ncbi:MAG: transcription antitermination factor NusB [Victivallales bacterium]|nr:transcription antitermination factor NusB [Victivallales bacterium]